MRFFYTFRPDCFEGENGSVAYMKLFLRGIKFLGTEFKDFAKVDENISASADRAIPVKSHQTYQVQAPCTSPYG